MHSVFHHARDLRTGDARAQRYTVADPLGHRDQIRRDAPVLESPERRPRPAKASLHLVGYTQTTVLADDIVNDLEILGRRSHRSAYALDRLGNEAGNFAWRLILDQIFDITGTFDIAVGYSRP